jgi:hypothetical protein
MRIAGFLILVLLVACEMPRQTRPDEGSWYSSRGFEALDGELVWTMLDLELSKRAHDLDPTLCNRTTGDFETRWVTNLHPFRYEGTRTKYLGRIEPVAEQPGWYRVRALVWVQRNADLKDPMDERKAIWQDDAPDEAATEVFLFAMDSHFKPVSGR